MATRARWQAEFSAPAEYDPFDGVPSTGVRSEAPVDLHRRLAWLVKIEGRLFGEGVRCPIRESAGTCCSVCPVSQSAQDTPLGQLCRVGGEQERIATQIAAQDAAEQAPLA